MLNFLLNIKRYGQFVIILILIAFSAAQSIRITVLKEDIANYKLAIAEKDRFIDAYKLEGERIEKQYKKAENEVEQLEIEQEKIANAVMNAADPQSCDEAIQFLAKWGPKLK